MIRNRVELAITEIIEGDRKGLLPALFKMTALPLSSVFKIACRLRNRCYDQGYYKQNRVSTPLISIGNVAVGGVGKTPLVLKLVKELSSFGKIALVARGYRAPAEHFPCSLLLSDGTGPRYSSSLVGDEAYLLSNNFPQTMVWVGRNKMESVLRASNAGAHLIIIDDGLQNRQIYRDLDIVVVNAHDPLAKKHFLPRGFLRDELRSLKRAHLIVVNHGGKRVHEFNEQMLLPFTEAPLVHVGAQAVGCFDCSNDLRLDESIQGKKVAIFCGIANPRRFQIVVESLGARVVEKWYFPDHFPIDRAELEKFAHRSKTSGAQLLLCTEKDRVKWSGWQLQNLPVAWLKIELSILKGHEHWNCMNEKIRELMSQKQFGEMK